MFSLFSAGSNSQGQLAIGSCDDSHTFSNCLFASNTTSGLQDGFRVDIHSVLNITGGANHTVILLKLGNEARSTWTQVWGCGDGSKGQLGAAVGNEPRTAFQPIDLALYSVGIHGYFPRTIACAWEATFVSLSYPGHSDILISMGTNDYGDLGIGGSMGKGKNSETPVHIVGFSHLLVGELEPVPDTLTINKVAAGPHHVVVHLTVTLVDRTRRGLVVGWGAARHGQLGSILSSSGRAAAVQALPTIITIETDDQILGLSAGSQHTVLRYSSGRVVGYGSNKKSQLAELCRVTDARDVGCTWNGTYIGIKDGIFSTGSHVNGQLGRTISTAATLAPVEFPFDRSSQSLMQMACGSEHVVSLFLESSTGATAVWGWGWNEHGNLGIGTTDDVQLPIRLWANEDEPDCRVKGVWAGCGTSWILVSRQASPTTSNPLS